MNVLATLVLLVATSKGVVTAHDHRIELAGAWRVDGVQHPTFIAAHEDRVVVLDAINNEAVIVEDGRTERIKTAETPIAASFVGDALFILARDGGVLHHVGGEDTQVRADLLKNEWLYSRATGALTKIGGATVQVPPFASDLEVDGDTVYLTYPREAAVRSVRGGKVETLRVGAVPVDLAIAGTMIAVADPSSKRIWITEGRQSVAEAFARGFIRGFLGLSSGRRDREFPTGVDRVATRGRVWIAYDSSSGTLYSFTKKQSTVIARNVPANGWTLTANGVAWWDGTSVAQKTLR
ncbi:MAG TPA: hypothetical protein VNI54_08570 [Thermoanaerobaculia bacterium]|nr:hypothetical protein [Thermoanaerobaculia bacterium]